MSKQFVRCCDDTRDGAYIWLDEDIPYSCFRYNADGTVIEYCPFCGILLDLNLEMSE